MSCPAEIKAAARAELSKRRAQSVSQTEKNRANVFSKIPEAANLEREISMASAMVARTVLAGGADIENKIKHIRDVNLEGQKKLAALLKANGFSEDALADVCVCRICKDSGVSPDGMVCQCVRELERSLMFEKLAKSSNFSGKDFSSFCLDAFDAQHRPVMEKVYSFCVDYAESFSPSAQSLLMIGSPGLGKTHDPISIGSAADSAERPEHE